MHLKGSKGWERLNTIASLVPHITQASQISKTQFARCFQHGHHSLHCTARVELAVRVPDTIYTSSVHLPYLPTFFVKNTIAACALSPYTIFATLLLLYLFMNAVSDCLLQPMGIFLTQRAAASVGPRITDTGGAGAKRSTIKVFLPRVSGWRFRTLLTTEKRK